MNFKKITHYVAAAVVALAGFAISPAGQALVTQYPKLSAVFGAIGALALLYHNPKTAGVLLLFLALCSPGFAQTPVDGGPAIAVQHFVISTTAGSYGGSAVAIASTGIQLIQQPSYAISVAYEFISNPNDSNKPRVGSGIVNYTRSLSSFLPTSLKSKLVIDTTNYNITFQGGGGRESVSNGVSLPRSYYTVGNFAIYGSRPLPGGHTQVGLGYKWIVGAHGGLVKVPAGVLNFTF